jgi:hypothetical protein
VGYLLEQRLPRAFGSDQQSDLQQFKADHLKEVDALKGRGGIFFDGTTLVARGQVQK